MVQSVLARSVAVPGHSSTKLTYTDYLLLPDDGLRHEIIGGEHFVTPSPVTRHQRISLNLLYLIRSYLEEHPTGELFGAPFDVLLSDFDVVVPDIVYISRERSHFITAKNLQGPPDLAIEILSPSTKSRDKRLKCDLYERAGVREYWMVDPDGPGGDVVTVHRRSAAGAFQKPIEHRRGQVLKSPLFPGLELSIEKVLG
jgi:Uma2 family endonuclease